MELCDILIDVIDWLMNLETWKNISGIFLSTVTGVSIIKGVGYLKDFKEKTNAATFTFWTQLRMKLFVLMKWLEEDNSLVNNLYSPSSKDTWESDLSQSSNRIQEFQDKVKNLIHYIETTSDQMPAYNGWIADYNFIFHFLSDIIQYDICNAQEFFKYNDERSIQHRTEYCNKVCKAMKRMCEGIETRQQKVEKEIYDH